MILANTRLQRGILAALLVVVLLAGGPALWAQDNPLHDVQPQVGGQSDSEVAPTSHRGGGSGREGNLEAITAMVLAVLLGVCAFALLTLIVVLAPGRTAALAARVPGSFLKRFLVGAANTAFMVILIRASHNALAILIVPFFLVLFVLGLMVLCDEVGIRIQIVAGAEWNRLTRLGVGWTILYLASWFPFLGWFIVAPVTVLTAVGAMLLWLLSKREPAPPPSPVAPA